LTKILSLLTLIAITNLTINNSCQHCCWWRDRQYAICGLRDDVITIMTSCQRRCTQQTHTEQQTAAEWTFYLYRSLCSLGEDKKYNKNDRLRPKTNW